MGLRHRGYLCEARQVVIDMRRYMEDVRKYVNDLYDSSLRTFERFKQGDPDVVARYKRYGYDPDDPGDWRKYQNEVMVPVLREAKRNMQGVAAKVSAAVSAIGESWTGSTVLVKPHYWYRTDRHGFSTFTPEGAVASDADVGLRRGQAENYKPDFTLFSDGVIDDVLDAGDRDFFPERDPGLESDYFMLVNEIMHPGSAQRQKGKILTLYTARPRNDRSRYDHAKSVPHGIFLTNDAERAYAIGMDLAGSTGRDVYMVRVDDRFLMKTLDSGRIKEYQVVGHGQKEVPVVKIERVS